MSSVPAASPVLLSPEPSSSTYSSSSSSSPPHPHIVSRARRSLWAELAGRDTAHHNDWRAVRTRRMDEDNAIRKAAKYMGYMSLQEEQTKAVKGILSGRDVIVCFPTGYGKTLCYSILPKAFDFLKENSQSVMVVVSPLIALMKDQVRALAKCNIR